MIRPLSRPILSRPILSRCRRLASDRSGTSLIEFALVLPVLVLLFTGTFQLNDALSVYRKVTTTSRTIADLTTQYTLVSDSDLDTILAASQQVMSPYSLAPASLTVTQVKIDALLNATVDWSRAKNGTALTPGSTVNIPLGVKQPNTSLVLAKVVYTYSPLFGSGFIGPIPMTETMLMSPRASSTITHS